MYNWPLYISGCFPLSKHQHVAARQSLVSQDGKTCPLLFILTVTYLPVSWNGVDKSFGQYFKGAFSSESKYRADAGESDWDLGWNFLSIVCNLPTAEYKVSSESDEGPHVSPECRPLQ